MSEAQNQKQAQVRVECSRKFIERERVALTESGERNVNTRGKMTLPAENAKQARLQRCGNDKGQLAKSDDHMRKLGVRFAAENPIASLNLQPERALGEVTK